MIDYDKIYTKCLKKMFKIVGEKYPNLELTQQKNWFQMRSWTTEQENKFIKWMRRYLKRKCKDWTDKLIENEIQWFLLNWGWKIKREWSTNNDHQPD